MASLGDRRYSRQGWRRFWLTLATFAVIAVYSSRSTPSQFINAGPCTMASPFVMVAGQLGSGFRGIASVYLNNTDASLKLQVADEEINRLKTELIELERLKRQVNMLRKQLEFSEQRKDLDLIPAEVVAKSNSGFSRRWTVRIEPSAQQSVKPGAPVVASNALIGQVITVDGHIAKVMLLSDPKSAVDVRLSSSGVQGVAVGAGDEANYGLRLKYLSQDETISSGERLLTSGKDGKFPSDLNVGQIASVIRKETTKREQIKVLPPVSLSELKYVFIVIGASGISADGASYKEKP